MDELEAQQIASLLGLPVRTIRYVIEHRLAPWAYGRVLKGRAGQPRAFTGFEAFGIAVAALLYERGVQRSLVADVLHWLDSIPWPLPRKNRTPDGLGAILEFVIGREPVISSALCGQGVKRATVSVGDGAFLRIKIDREDTGWIDPNTRVRLPRDYRPQVLIQVDLADLRWTFCRS